MILKKIQKALTILKFKSAIIQKESLGMPAHTKVTNVIRVYNDDLSILDLAEAPKTENHRLSAKYSYILVRC